VDWSKAQKVTLPNLNPTTKTISLPLPQHLLETIKVAAITRDVPYQSLIKVRLREKAAPVIEEFKARQSMGLVLPSAWYIAGALLFGIVGLLDFRRGRKALNCRFTTINSGHWPATIATGEVGRWAE
jgi:hypothetical protein